MYTPVYEQSQVHTITYNSRLWGVVCCGTGMRDTYSDRIPVPGIRLYYWCFLFFCCWWLSSSSCCWRRVPGVIGSWFIERRFLERRSRIDPQDPKFHRAAILLSVLRADPCTMNSKEQNAGLPKEYNTPNAPLARSWERPRSCVDTNCYKDLVRTPVPPAANMVVNGTCMIYHIIV